MVSKEMIEGKPLKSIIKFTVPILIGNLFQQLYATVDTIIVGQTLSTEALAGVGATAALSFLFVGFIQGMSMGFSVVTSQRFGANDEQGVRKSVAITFWLSAVFAVLLTVVGALTTMPLLRMLQTPDNIIQYSYDYLFVVFAGISATVIYNLGACIMRALGDSRTPLIYLIAASIVNVALDCLFIMVFDMGVAGAGIATVLSQGLSGIACFIHMFIKFPILKLKREDWKTDARFVFNHITVAMPMALQYSIIAIGIMVQQFALNRLGSDVVAAYTAAYKIEQFATQILFSLGMALATYCGQNYGAHRMDRIWTGVNKTSLLSVICAIVVGAIVILCSEPLVKIFIPNITAQVLDYAQMFIFFQAVFYIFLAGIFIYRNALQGMGYSVFTVIACIVELAFRAVASIVFTKYWGFTGVCFSSPSAWIGAAVILVIAFYVIIRKKLIQQPSPALEQS